MKFDMCRAKLKGTTQPINAAHLTVVLCGLAYDSLKQAVLHCSDPSAVRILCISMSLLRTVNL